MKEVVQCSHYAEKVNFCNICNDEGNDRIDMLNNSNLKNHFIEIQNCVEHITEVSLLSLRWLRLLLLLIECCLTRRRARYQENRTLRDWPEISGAGLLKIKTTSGKHKNSFPVQRTFPLLRKSLSIHIRDEASLSLFFVCRKQKTFSHYIFIRVWDVLITKEEMTIFLINVCLPPQLGHNKHEKSVILALFLFPFKLSKKNFLLSKLNEMSKGRNFLVLLIENWGPLLGETAIWIRISIACSFDFKCLSFVANLHLLGEHLSLQFPFPQVLTFK